MAITEGTQMSYVNSSDPFAGIPELDQDCPVSSTSGYANAGHAFQAGETKLDAQLFECEQCNGKGTKLIGRVNLRHVECFYCNGTGKRKTSAEHRAKLKATRKANEQKRAADKAYTFQMWLKDTTDEERSAMLWLRGEVEFGGFYGKSDFSRDMIKRIDSRDILTFKMLAAIVSMRKKADAFQAKREQERANDRVENAVSDQFAQLFAALNKAKGEYKSKPIFRNHGIRVKFASESGVNAGFLDVTGDVKHDDGHYGFYDYLGKISPAGEFKPDFKAKQAGLITEQVMDSINALAKDPENAALTYGRETGRCCLCGRELTKHSSIGDGIGPTCKEKWGF